MKVTKIETYVARVPYKRVESSSLINRGGVTDVIVKVTADNGLVGWGECTRAADTAGVESAVNAMTPLVLGRSPWQRELIHRELAIYAIQIAKGGPKLTPAKYPDATPNERSSGKGTEATVTYTSATMQDFTAGEQRFLDRPLIDQTGLTGKYDFSLHYTYDEARATDPNAPPGIFTAMQGQLGLKLVPVKAPVDVLVIDHVERPSEN